MLRQMFFFSSSSLISPPASLERLSTSKPDSFPNPLSSPSNSFCPFARSSVFVLSVIPKKFFTDSVIPPKKLETFLIAAALPFVLLSLYFGTKGGYYDSDNYTGDGCAHDVKR